MPALKKALRGYTPSWIISAYHFSLACIGALRYNFPSRRIMVVGVTGTKGKSSTVEYLNAIFEAAGHTTAVSNSVRTKVGPRSNPNAHRMSMPGRFALQAFLKEAVTARCTIAFVEMTSEGAAQHRHRCIALDGLIFTNLAPEHIESHGSLERYIDAKVSIGTQLARSPKRPRIVVARSEDSVSARFLALPVEKKIPFSLEAARPYHTSTEGGSFTFMDEMVRVALPGRFSLENALAAAHMAHAMGVPAHTIAEGISSVREIPGRAQRITAGQDFTVVVDYAHNPSSYEALFAAYRGVRTICVIGSTGGGRDTWKRPEMGRIAESSCETVIVTNEDPYDEDPEAIVQAIVSGMKRTPLIELDRRSAIRMALRLARPGDAVLITGKGTDPTICGARGTSVPWSDALVAKEELTAMRNGQIRA